MKKSVITNHLSQYKKHKGGFRYLSNEPHIKELKDFHGKLKNAYLNPDELQELANIISRKEDRSRDKLSSRIFDSLAQKFGGYKALDILNKQKVGGVTDIEAAFLVKNPDHGINIAGILTELYDKVYLHLYQDILSASQQVTDKKQVPVVLEFLSNNTKTPSFHKVMDIIKVLNKNNICTDDLIPQLFNTDQHNTLQRIFDNFDASCRSLITKENVLKVINLKYPQDFLELIPSLFPATQFQLDCLYSVDANHSYVASKNVLNHFRLAKWNLNEYMIKILTDKNQVVLAKATQRLKEQALHPEFLNQVLKEIFTHSEHAVILVDAALILRNAGFSDDLDKAFANPEHADKLALAITELRQEHLYHDSTLELIAQNPEFSDGLANFLVQWHNSCKNAPVPKLILNENPQSAKESARVIGFLNEHQLNKKENIDAICNACLTNDVLFNILLVLKKTNMVNQKNLEKIFLRFNCIDLLRTGLENLYLAGKLDQYAFDSLIVNRENAVEAAETLINPPEKVEVLKPIPTKKNNFFNQVVKSAGLDTEEDEEKNASSIACYYNC